METTAVRLIRVHPAGPSFLTLPDCRVDYRPKQAYRATPSPETMPWFSHRVGVYHEDSIDLAIILDAEDYHALTDFLAAPGAIYIEFTWAGTDVLQLPVSVSELPPLPDDLREFTAETSLSLISRRTSPGTDAFDPTNNIDWTTYTVPEGIEDIHP